MESLIDDILTMQADVKRWPFRQLERLVARSMSGLSDEQYSFARRILSQAEASGRLPNYRKHFMEEVLDSWPWQLLSSKMLTIHQIERLSEPDSWPEGSFDEWQPHPTWRDQIARDRQPARF
ncbi:MAG: hypothetical protein JXQ73_33915 [Phycisphaerae bacterium]|nr:hypothetical protein [Phycisphaerae bacterium]